MREFIVTQNHMLAKIGQLTIENEILRNQLQEVLAKLQTQQALQAPTTDTSVTTEG